MAHKSSDTHFDAWLSTLGVSAEVPSEATPWLRRFFQEEGPADRDAVLMAYELEQVSMTEQALRVVLDDIHRTTSLKPTVKVDKFRYGVCIFVDGDVQSSLSAIPEPQLMLQEVADYMQEFVMADKMVWPTCSMHRTGLHADVVDGSAVWRCRYGDHTVAVVGQLPTTEA